MFDKSKESAKTDKSGSKSLRTFSRQELLQLLLEQMEEAKAQKEELDNLKETYERLKVKLNEKDEQIEDLQRRMKEKLDDKDAKARELRERLTSKLDKKDEQIEGLRAYIEAIKGQKVIGMEEIGSIAEASIKINEVFEAAQRAADQYLESVMARYGDAKQEICSKEVIKTYLKIEEEIKREMETENASFNTEEA